MATALTIPFDVIKTRLQTQAILGEQKYRGVVHTAATIIREEGYRGLTRCFFLNFFSTQKVRHLDCAAIAFWIPSKSTDSIQ